MSEVKSAGSSITKIAPRWGSLEARFSAQGTPEATKKKEEYGRKFLSAKLRAKMPDFFADGRVLRANEKFKGPWTEEEDKALVAVVEELGAKKWSRIASALNSGRNSKQCRERWSNQINPNLVRTRWTPEEDATIIRLQAKLGNSWAAIAKHISGRTDNMIKNRFNGSLKSRVRGGETPRRGRGFSKKPRSATASLSAGKRRRLGLNDGAAAAKRSKSSQPRTKAKRKLNDDGPVSFDDEVAAIAALRVLSASPAKFNAPAAAASIPPRGSSARKLKFSGAEAIEAAAAAVSSAEANEVAVAFTLAERTL